MTSKPSNDTSAPEPAAALPGVAQESPEPAAPRTSSTAAQREFGGRKDGTEPTRYGDWEKNGRCVDF